MFKRLFESEQSPPYASLSMKMHLEVLCQEISKDLGDDFILEVGRMSTEFAYQMRMRHKGYGATAAISESMLGAIERDELAQIVRETAHDMKARIMAAKKSDAERITYRSPEVAIIIDSVIKHIKTVENCTSVEEIDESLKLLKSELGGWIDAASTEKKIIPSSRDPRNYHMTGLPRE